MPAADDVLASVHHTCVGTRSATGLTQASVIRGGGAVVRALWLSRSGFTARGSVVFAAVTRCRCCCTSVSVGARRRS
jgi:hypothetical protein